MFSQGLGAFAVAVGHLGLEGATTLCESRAPSPELSAAFDALGYTVDHLPTQADINLVLIGVEIRRRQVVLRANGKLCAVRDAAAGLCTSHDASRSLDALESFGLSGVTFNRVFDNAALGAF